MKSVLNNGFIAYTILIIVVILLDLNANITFGHGMGDIYYLITIFFIGIFASLIWFFLLKKNQMNFGIKYFISF